MIHTLSVIFSVLRRLSARLSGRLATPGRKCLTLPLAANLARRETKFTWNFDLLEKAVTGGPARLFEQFREKCEAVRLGGFAVAFGPQLRRNASLQGLGANSAPRRLRR
ncbi:MAG: hypothetical protein E5W74_13535 [Mesorhizobium sp.]|uniref:hypothetical protein n=1 Tax=Mesorhizobium sp. TaxID=1871066 RepID=UPI0012210165|nr:hypothetical protein [Mesorhizobium sp.]TIT11327.1 MAG: hypothetical protein E5W74_13535 [Mesorhizobium sp.]TJW62448.1 MAG: hypothetical protein E5V97_16800 [Mesorhizobium sp.]